MIGVTVHSNTHKQHEERPGECGSPLVALHRCRYCIDTWNKVWSVHSMEMENMNAVSCVKSCLSPFARC
jgi:hypothetical protein